MFLIVVTLGIMVMGLYFFDDHCIPASSIVVPTRDSGGETTKRLLAEFADTSALDSLVKTNTRMARSSARVLLTINISLSHLIVSGLALSSTCFATLVKVDDRTARPKFT